MRTAAYVLLALAATTVYGAEVYRSTDANGNVIYSDRPENETSRSITVLTGHAVSPPPLGQTRAFPFSHRPGAQKKLSTLINP